MDHKQALEALLAKVEAGEAVAADFEPCLAVLDFGLAWSAYHGSLDAAEALHEAVLCNRVISSLDWKWGGLVEAHIFEVSPEQWHEQGMAKFIGRSSTPARAWLCAILKALIAKGAE